MSFLRRQRQQMRANVEATLQKMQRQAENPRPPQLPTCWRCMKPYDAGTHPAGEGLCACVYPVAFSYLPRNAEERWQRISAHIISSVHAEIRAEARVQ